MAGSDLNTSSSGIHPGKPIIWPSGKSSAQSESVKQAQTTQTAGGVRPSAGAKTAGVTAPAQAQMAPAVSAPKAAVNIARALTMADIKQHLTQLQVPDSDFNVTLASLMIKDGMEISRTNFIALLSMLTGTDKSLNMQEAAIMLLMKGIESPEALQILGKFFSENPQIAAQLTALLEGLGNLSTALSVSQGLLNPKLVAQLGALLSQFDSVIKELNQKTQISGNNLKLLNDLSGLKSLLEGVQAQAQASDSAEAQVLQANLMSTLGKMNSAMDNLVAQALLSQKGREEVNYLYKQVPNTSVAPPKDVEIVVKRDGHGPQSEIDYENTQVILSLQTANLGKMVCSVYIKGKRVYVVFVFNEKQYGDEARELIAKEFSELQKKLSGKNFAVSGYQVKIDPAMCSVKPYLIPMLAKLGDQLKKIDLEA
ncbi:hypothetical protein HZC34_02325 [Candidatus Saganbacteria bacterium]|nr:hypothetical protein [Candidatus Saganbacteria bacterium]